MSQSKMISSPPVVEKISQFSGSLPPRDLYVYLPPNFDDHGPHPLLLLHDGQNCFESFADDSYTGSTWRADQTADQLIKNGRLSPFVMVGVSHGDKQRMIEYLPPYSTFEQKETVFGGTGRKRFRHTWTRGEAQQTAKFYKEELLPFLAERYHIHTDRQHIATCGSSMGGLFSMYLAWEFPEFARHHAALSASFWITEEADGRLAIAKRIQKDDPRDIRVWLDSGTEDRPGEGDDNSPGVIEVREALKTRGYREDDNLRYYLDEGAIHTESAWANRLPMILEFLTAEWGGVEEKRREKRDQRRENREER
ncbi:MAG: alpha/beta hydrolase-fold protein [Ardenticatenaceae bacterium]|nr:alpha/beta hydrolase-fold protein [Ardenticatenaceae bacterium]